MEPAGFRLLMKKIENLISRATNVMLVVVCNARKRNKSFKIFYFVTIIL